MNRKLTTSLLLLLIWGMQLSAQPTFTSANCFQVGDTSRLGFSVFAESFESWVAQTGSNHTWDFSTTNWVEPTVPYVFQAATASIHTLFAGSDINEYGLVLFPRDLFYTYSAGQDTLYYDGLYTSTNYLYRPHVPYLTFPLDFGDSASYYGQQFANVNQPTTATGSVTRRWVYDGYGTLQLPYGTIPNCYRIRTHQVDSIYVISSGTPYDELIWFRASDGIPVLRFLKNATLISAYYTSASSGPTGLGEAGTTPRPSAWPVPFGNSLKVQPSSYPLTEAVLFDGLGNVVSRAQNNAFETSQLPAGTYWLRTRDNHGQVFRQVVCKMD